MGMSVFGVRCSLPVCLLPAYFWKYFQEKKFFCHRNFDAGWAFNQFNFFTYLLMSQKVFGEEGCNMFNDSKCTTCFNSYFFVMFNIAMLQHLENKLSIFCIYGQYSFRNYKLM